MQFNNPNSINRNHPPPSIINPPHSFISITSTSISTQRSSPQVRPVEIEEMESNGSVWLADSMHAVDNNVKQLLKLIENTNIQISDEDLDTKDQKRPNIASYVDNLHSQYRLLAERYNQLAKEQVENIHELDENLVSPFYTPVSKFTEHKSELQAVASDICQSDLTYKNGYGSSSTSLTDSDLESLNPELLANDLDGDKRVAHSGKESNLLKRIEECETELQIANAKVKSSEEEVTKLKSKLEENEVVVKQLKDELEVSHALAEKKDAVISMENSKVSKLEGRISSDADELSKYSEEVRRLKEALADSHSMLLQKDLHYQSEMSSLLEQKNLVEKTCEERQLQIISLENEISGLRIEIAQVKNAHDAIEASWKTEMKSLEAENSAKSDTVESLNKCADALKLNYDTANARLETLTAELSHKDNAIQELNERINHLNLANANLNVNISNLRENQNAVRQLEECATQSQIALCQAISNSDELNKCVDTLRVRVSELEEELEEQRALFAEGAELKREAIRQLCISLEHYRSGYLEFRDVVVGKKRRTHTRTDVGS